MWHEIKNKREKKKNSDTIQQELKGFRDIKMAMTGKQIVEKEIIT